MLTMDVGMQSGRFESRGAMLRSAPALAQLRVDALVVRLASVRAVVVLPLVGLVIGLILITAGCGPPS